jgi:hypothetical protein
MNVALKEGRELERHTEENGNVLRNCEQGGDLR